MRAEKGFGLIELLMAMTMLNIGILAIVAAFNSGTVAISRASRISTASALADAQMELYRAITYDAIALDTTAVNTAGTDAYYTGDTTAYSASQVTATCVGSPLPNQCDPRRTVYGPDHKNYRVYTYIVLNNPTVNSRPLKQVTVVVRDDLSPAKVFTRESTTFDKSTGCVAAPC